MIKYLLILIPFFLIGGSWDQPEGEDRKTWELPPAPSNLEVWESKRGAFDEAGTDNPPPGWYSNENIDGFEMPFFWPHWAKRNFEKYANNDLSPDYKPKWDRPPLDANTKFINPDSDRTKGFIEVRADTFSHFTVFKLDPPDGEIEQDFNGKAKVFGLDEDIIYKVHCFDSKGFVGSFTITAIDKFVRVSTESGVSHAIFALLELPDNNVVYWEQRKTDSPYLVKVDRVGRKDWEFTADLSTASSIEQQLHWLYGNIVYDKKYGRIVGSFGQRNELGACSYESFGARIAINERTLADVFKTDWLSGFTHTSIIKQNSGLSGYVTTDSAIIASSLDKWTIDNTPDISYFSRYAFYIDLINGEGAYYTAGVEVDANPLPPCTVGGILYRHTESTISHSKQVAGPFVTGLAKSIYDDDHIFSVEHSSGGQLTVRKIKASNLDLVDSEVLFSSGVTSQSLEPCSDGGLILSGAKFNTVTGKTEALLLKFDGNLNKEWHSLFSGDPTKDTWGKDAIQTVDGGFLLGGYIDEGEWKKQYLVKTNKYGKTCSQGAPCN